ncbi:MAG: hypothetical protein JXX14_13690 [Deltaproteobacteria bacterium]|nr:hypothetical protein [Deltaproteobacteria bacterium]
MARFSIGSSLKTFAVRRVTQKNAETKIRIAAIAECIFMDRCTVDELWDGSTLDSECAESAVTAIPPSC